MMQEWQQVPFYNQVMDKGAMKELIGRLAIHFGGPHTSEILDQIKLLGFEQATQAAISLGIDDLLTTPSKVWLVEDADYQAHMSDISERQGNIHAVEKLRQLVETWYTTSEHLKKEMSPNFKMTNPLNPVHMMSFSGARGSISQVHQLVGMRGLMSDPQGQIIDLPIQSNFREGLSLTEYIISCYGARKGVVDTAVRTADAGYLTRRLVEVVQHMVVRKIDCGSLKGIHLDAIQDHKGDDYVSREERLVGRVLASPVYQDRQCVAVRNEEIYAGLAFQLAAEEANTVLVRSPVSCKGKSWICQLCYGWSLAHGQIVDLGEAVGIIAGQSIGEPGTQLTLRTFHTGGVFTGDIAEHVRAPFNGLVRFDPQKTVLTRSRHGRSARICQEDLPLVVEGADEDEEMLIPAQSLLLVSQNQYVQSQQVIGEIRATTAPLKETVQKNVYSDLAGEMYWGKVNLDWSNSSTAPLHLTSTSHIWVLAGHSPFSLFPYDPPLHDSYILEYGLYEHEDMLTQRRLVSRRLLANHVFEPLMPITANCQKHAKEGHRNYIERHQIHLSSSLACFFQYWLKPYGFKYEKEEKEITSDLDSTSKSKNISQFPFFPHITDSGKKLQSLVFFLEKSKVNSQWHEHWQYLPAYTEIVPGVSMNKDVVLYIKLWPLKLDEAHPQVEWCVGIIIIDGMSGRSMDEDPSILKNLNTLDTGQTPVVVQPSEQMPAAKLGCFFSSLFIKAEKGVSNSSKNVFQTWKEISKQSNHYGYKTPNALVSSVWNPNRQFKYTHFTNHFNELSWKSLNYLTKQSKYSGLAKDEDTYDIVCKHVLLPRVSDNYRLYAVQRLYASPGKMRIFDRVTKTNHPTLSADHGKLLALSLSFMDLRKIPLKNASETSCKKNSTQTDILSVVLDADTSSQRWTPVLQSALQVPTNRIRNFQEDKLRKPYVGLLGHLYRPGQYLCSTGRLLYMDESTGHAGLTEETAWLTDFSISYSCADLRQEIVWLDEQGQAQKISPKGTVFSLSEYLGKASLSSISMRSHLRAKFGELFLEKRSSVLGLEGLARESGMIVAITEDYLWMRLARPYLATTGAAMPTKHADAIQAGDLLMTLTYERLRSGDIIQGLPKVEQLLEGRSPQARAFNQEGSQTGWHGRLRTMMDSVWIRASRASFEMVQTQLYLIDEIQKVYQTQGVRISDKHIELVVRQMTSKGIVEELNTQELEELERVLPALEFRLWKAALWSSSCAYARFLPGEIIDLAQVHRTSCIPGRGVMYRPIVLGITKASLHTHSFLSEASFQQTVKVLSTSAIRGRTDWLKGLKENVIIGHTIPAGTGCPEVFWKSYKPKFNGTQLEKNQRHIWNREWPPTMDQVFFASFSDQPSLDQSIKRVLRYRKKNLGAKTKRRQKRAKAGPKKEYEPLSVNPLKNTVFKW
uniref:DNA-directed RNA polymerase subunit beta'' n=1 Tax=Mesotaenium endlicherianum TaxID=184485 RepID=A0A024B4E9_9VIRI|nr:beta'' subunit of RNA polymerase [Mesotaenium endlicherianum]AHZ11242.1 beta'' subunit of RNA polymerase [Mesotaenium endlicherianum]